MTAPYLQGTGVIPEATALRLRGVQTDAYGEILGGHKALYDFMQSGVTGRPITGELLPNLIAGGEPLTVVRNFSTAANVETKKGLNFTVANAVSNEVAGLPAAFDFNTLGAEPCIVLSMWLTQDVDSGTTLDAIMGYAHQTGTDAQWYIAHDNVANRLRFGLSTSVSIQTIPITDGEPTLLTFHFRRTGAGTFVVDTYKGKVLLGSLTRNYPFATPVSASATRQIGIVGGFSGGWAGTLHRLQLIKVPQGFDIATWIAAEIAANAARWA